MRGLWSEVRHWLEANKIFFETFSWLILTIAALWFAWQANTLIARQNDLVSRQGELLAEQTALTKTQTDIARSTISPRFSFSQKDYDRSCVFEVSSPGDAALQLKGRLTHFCETEDEEGRTARVPVKGVFLSVNQDAARDGRLIFPLDGDLREWPYDGSWGSRLASLTYIRQSLFIEISYLNRAGEPRVERYVMDSTGGGVRPVAECPALDPEFDASDYRAAADESKEQREIRFAKATAPFEQYMKGVLASKLPLKTIVPAAP